MKKKKKMVDVLLEDMEVDQELLAAVVANTNNAVIVTDLDGRILYTNEGFTKITEYTQEEVVGRKPGSFLQGPETDPDTVAAISQGLKNRERIDETIINYSKTGRKYWLKLDIYPQFDAAGVCTHFLAIESDVTEMKMREQQLADQNHRIQDNITYALKLQESLFKKTNFASNFFKDIFILDRPKDTVGGDFYLIEEIQGKKVVFVGDCTGHGVSGAIMTAIVVAIIKDLLHTYKALSPSLILRKAQERLKETLANGQETVSDSFDGSILFIDEVKSTIRYASINQDIYVYHPSNTRKIKGTRERDLKRKNKELEDQVVSYDEGTMVYLSSDGIRDQFGGEMDKKFTSARLEETLEGMHTESCIAQREVLQLDLETWKGDLEQTDDILLLGIRL